MVKRALAQKNHQQMALDLLLQYELEEVIEPRLMVELYQVLSTTYESAINYGQQIPRVVIDFVSEVVHVVGWSGEEDCIRLIQASILESRIYPENWIVNFLKDKDNCWLGNVAFSTQKVEIMDWPLGPPKTKDARRRT